MEVADCLTGLSQSGDHVRSHEAELRFPWKLMHTAYVIAKVPKP